jgi:hypothetical protein
VLTTSSSQGGTDWRASSASATLPMTGADPMAATTISATPAPSAMLRKRPVTTL